MTHSQAARLKSYIAQLISHPKLSAVEKMELAEKFIDLIQEETQK